MTFVALVVMIIVAVVVMIAVVFSVPVPLMDLPALLVVIVVWMGPVGARVRWLLPDAGDPNVASAAISPVTVDPGIAFTGHRRPCLIAQWWRWGADIDVNLAECRDR